MSLNIGEALCRRRDCNASNGVGWDWPVCYIFKLMSCRYLYMVLASK